MLMKNSNDTIGNGTRDLPTCSAVPQLTAPLRAPFAATALPFISHSRVTDMYTWKEHHFGHEFIVILTTRPNIHSGTPAGCSNT